MFSTWLQGGIHCLPLFVGVAWLTRVFHVIYSYTAKTKYRNFETNIPRKGISGPQSQFQHSCVCERFIYSHDRSPYSAGGNMYTNPGTI
jgi:hypothetical protein